MGNLHIVTGYLGENHVTAADVGSFQAAIFGEGEYVLNRGNKFSASVISNNQIRVADGDILMQGRHIRMNEGTYVDLTIENGSSGYYRNDLIVARYTKNSSSGVEDVSLVVIKGTPAASDPVDPEYTAGDIINDHVYLADMPLYRVPLNGLNVEALVPLFAEGKLAGEYTAQIGTTWSGSSAPYTQTIIVPGIQASDNPIVDMIPSASFATAEKEMDAWASIYNITTAENSITVYAKDKTTQAINIRLVVNN